VVRNRVLDDSRDDFVGSVVSQASARASLSSTVRRQVAVTSKRLMSIESAIARGQRMVNYPVLALLASPAFVIVVFGKKLNALLGEALSAKVECGFFVFCFVSAWLWWSIAVPRWRLWAYERVSDIAALKAAAISSKLTWPDNSIFAQTEIKSRAHATREKELEAAQVHKHGD